MKNNSFLVALLVFAMSTINAIETPKNLHQENETFTVKGVFDGFDAEDGYAFIIENTDEKSEDYTFFETVLPEVLKTTDLKSEKLIGKKFEITYQVSKYEVEEDNGIIETYQRLIILKLKQL